MEVYEVPEAVNYMYIMGSSSGTLYIGSTTSLIKRVWEHKNKEVVGSFTERCNVCKLLYFESFLDFQSGLDREYQIKRWSRKKKFFIIDQKNPLHLDWANDWFE